MKIKTSDLKCRQLDYAVAIAVGFTINYLMRHLDNLLDYSDNWFHCGDLITEYEIHLSNENGMWFASMSPHMNESIQSGETPQIAICRAVVFNFLGDEVDIPDELVDEDE